MVKNPTLRKKIFALTNVRLETIGFQRRRPGIFTIYLSPECPDVMGWLGLNTLSRAERGVIRINPVVGVRYNIVESVISDLLGEKSDNVDPPTISRNIGYTSPYGRYHSFMFSGTGVDEATADELCKSVSAFGIPFILKYTDPMYMIDAMKSNSFGIGEYHKYRIPVILWTIGNMVEAKYYIRQEIDQIGMRTDAAAHRYRTFAAAFFEKLL